MWPRKLGPESFHVRRAASPASVHKPLRVAISSVVRRAAATAVFLVDAMRSPFGATLPRAPDSGKRVRLDPSPLGVEFRREACNPCAFRHAVSTGRARGQRSAVAKPSRPLRPQRRWHDDQSRRQAARGHAVRIHRGRNAGLHGGAERRSRSTTSRAARRSRSSGCRAHSRRPARRSTCRATSRTSTS